jgi:hypothetical protein
MQTQAQPGSPGKLQTVEQPELAAVSGGVMPVYDDQGNIIRTCTGPVQLPDLKLLVLNLLRLN